MNYKYFILAIFALPFAANARFLPESVQVFVTNNGQIDLIVNGVLVPANPMDKQTYPVSSINNSLIISVPGQESEQAHVVKLLDGDAGNTIQIGGYYNHTEERYMVAVLRSNKIPLILPLKNAKKRLSLPKKL